MIPSRSRTRARIIGDESIEYVKNNYDALKGVDALLLLTEWHHFRKPDFDKMKVTDEKTGDFRRQEPV